jgi:hypothetical protein
VSARRPPYGFDHLPAHVELPGFGVDWSRHKSTVGERALRVDSLPWFEVGFGIAFAVVDEYALPNALSHAESLIDERAREAWAIEHGDDVPFDPTAA